MIENIEVRECQKNGKMDLPRKIICCRIPQCGLMGLIIGDLLLVALGHRLSKLRIYGSLPVKLVSGTRIGAVGGVKAARPESQSQY